MEIEAIVEEHAHHFLKDLKAEYTGDKEAVFIVHKYMKGEKISSEEDHILKTQF